jgi:hypothetical protein
MDNKLFAKSGIWTDNNDIEGETEMEPLLDTDDWEPLAILTFPCLNKDYKKKTWKIYHSCEALESMIQKSSDRVADVFRVVVKWPVWARKRMQ